MKLLGAALLSGLLLAGVAFPFIGGLGAAAKGSVTAFQDQKCDTTVLDEKPPQRSKVVAADGKTVIAQFYDQNREPVPLDQIQEWTRKAVVAIEDRRFYDHHGVDVTGTLRALIKSGTAGEVTQGGSTLTQQYVKQARLYLSANATDREKATEDSASRKLSEARCALDLETQLTAKYGQKRGKEEIIGKYLNIANFGAGAYGIGVAAQTYFGITADKLNLAQSALLAGVVNSPTRYNPLTHPKESRQRRHDVLSAMLNQGYITKDQFNKADKEPLVPAGMQDRENSQRAGKGCANANGNINNVGFFCDYLVSYLENTLKITPEKLNTGGLTITATIDPTMQAYAQNAIKDKVGYDKSATAVMNIVDPSNGQVRAMAVGRTYGSGDASHSVLPLATKPITGTGSTYKLFTTIAALRARVPVNDFKLDTFNDKKQDGERERDAYKPQNCPQNPPSVANAGTYDEFMNLHDALYQSSNTYFEALIDQKFGCDLTEVVKAARDLGMTTTLATKNQQSGNEQGKAAVDEHQISFTLGPISTDPLELTSAYGAMDNNGLLCPARPITQVVGPDNRPLPGVTLPGCTQAVDPAIANTVTSILQSDTDPNAKHSTAPAANLSPWPTAGKSGTSQDNAAVWFVGYTKQLVAGVGVFHPDAPNKPLDEFGVPAEGQFGGKMPAEIWHDTMQPIMAGMTPTPFPNPDETVLNGDSVPVPDVRGKSISDAQNELTQAGFKPVIGEPKDGGPQDRIVAQSPTGRAPQGSDIVLSPGTGKGGGGGGGGGGGNPGGGGGGGNTGGGHGRGGGGGGGVCIPGIGGCPP